MPYTRLRITNQSDASFQLKMRVTLQFPQCGIQQLFLVSFQINSISKSIYIKNIHRVWKWDLKPCPLLSFPDDGRVKEEQSCTNLTKNQKRSSIHKSHTVQTEVKRPLISHRSAEKRLDQARLEARTPDERLSGDDDPNRISENTLKCLSSILLRMSSMKNRNGAENLPSFSTLVNRKSNEETNYWDPYGICSEFGKRDIGPYKKLCQVEAASINPNRITTSLFLIRKLK